MVCSPCCHVHVGPHSHTHGPRQTPPKVDPKSSRLKRLFVALLPSSLGSGHTKRDLWCEFASRSVVCVNSHCCCGPQKSRRDFASRSVWPGLYLDWYNTQFLTLKAESHLAVCVSVCLFFALCVHTWHGKSPTQQHSSYMPDTLCHIQKIEPISIFLHMTLHILVKMAKCAQYTMEALVPFFTQDAQRQVCFGLYALSSRALSTGLFPPANSGFLSRNPQCSFYRSCAFCSYFLHICKFVKNFSFVAHWASFYTHTHANTNTCTNLTTFYPMHELSGEMRFFKKFEAKMTN